jgi:putative PIN family toxin of toxin-antitoxin system
MPPAVRAVVDTSVLLRYLIKPSAAVRTLIEEVWLGNRFVMVTAEALLNELTDVLDRDYIRKLVALEKGEVLLNAIQANAEMVMLPDEIPPYTRDAKDDKFVACAIVGRADAIVTTDEDILVLGTIDRIETVTPHQFVRGFK